MFQSVHSQRRQSLPLSLLAKPVGSIIRTRSNSKCHFHCLAGNSAIILFSNPVLEFSVFVSCRFWTVRLDLIQQGLTSHSTHLGHLWSECGISQDRSRSQSPQCQSFHVYTQGDVAHNMYPVAAGYQRILNQLIIILHWLVDSNLVWACWWKPCDSAANGCRMTVHWTLRNFFGPPCSSVNTDRKATTSFPMNLRWTVYVFP